MTEKKYNIASTVIPQSNYRKTTNKDLKSLDTPIPAIGTNHPEKNTIKEQITEIITIVNKMMCDKGATKPSLEKKLFDTLFQSIKTSVPEDFEGIWKLIETPVLNQIKITFLTSSIDLFLMNYEKQLQFLVNKYKRHLPHHISITEGDDLQTIAQLELIETFKAWNPAKNPDIWPLAYTRINGAMKDHMRYISKADPTRFYDWVIDAANLYLAVNDDNSHESSIETSTELERALKELSPKERKIVTLYINEDLTFSEISKKINLSESQISRIYKQATKKIKTLLS